MNAANRLVVRFGLWSWVVVAVAGGATLARAGTVSLGGKTFTLPEGFTIEVAAKSPGVDRPIVCDFDERGRLYVADSSGSREPAAKQLEQRPHRILRLEDTDGDGVFDRSVVFADKMMFPEGVMWLDGSVYVAAPPSIWKLTDTNGDGVADERVEWYQGKTLTGCANDLHGPYAGLDGWVYWTKGAFAKQTFERPGRRPVVSRAAHVLRAAPSIAAGNKNAGGTPAPQNARPEIVMTGGMDNPVDVAFTAAGERIVSSTFLIQPAAGKRDGLVHAVYGGVYGKVHDVIDDQVRTSPDVMPVLSHLGPAASCGLHRYESGAFGEEYRDNLFSTSFNLHKVFRHVLKPAGATFASEDSDFLVCDSLDFHPTDVIEDADGSLLIVDTGGWYKLCCPTSQLVKPDVLGAIYRVRKIGAAKVDDPRGLKIRWDELVPGELAGLLDDPRVAVRRRAIPTLAARGGGAVAELERTLARSESAVARLNAVWCASRIDHVGTRQVVRAALGDADETVRQAAAHVAGLWRDGSAVPELARLLEDKSLQVRRAAAEGLGRVGGAGVASLLLQKVGQTNDKVLEHSLTYALIECNQPKILAGALAEVKGRPSQRRAAMIALDQSDDGGLRAADVLSELTSGDAATRETATWIAGRHADWDAAIAAALAGRIETDAGGGGRGVLQQQLAALAKVSKGVQELMAARLADPAATAAQRKLILAAMAQSGMRELPASWAAALAKVLQTAAAADGETISAATGVTRKIAVPAKSAELVAALGKVGARKGAPESARLDALSALPGNAVELEGDAVTFLLGQIAPNREAARRLAAAEVLGRAKLSAEQLGVLAGAVARAGPMEIDRLVNAFGGASDPAVGEKLVAALAESKSFSSVRADSLRKRLEKFPAGVRASAEALIARLAPDAAKQAERIEGLLPDVAKGDARRGQVVFNSAKVGCASCHTVGYVGGRVGPDLTKIGAIRSERDLLEAILYPSASFVQSYEPVILETKDGDVQAGILRKNDGDEVVLVTGPEQEVRIARGRVKEMRPGTTSVMPAGLEGQLTAGELADLVAFLKGCR